MANAQIKFDEIDEKYNLVLSRNGIQTTSYPLSEELYIELKQLFTNGNKPDFSKVCTRIKK